MNCANCLYKLSPGATSCPNCHMVFPEPVPGGPPQTAKRKVPTFVWVLSGCLVCSFLLPSIAILSAILFPVSAQAREKERQASCQSNERQMGLALMQYSEDNDNRLPIASKWMVSLHSYDKLDYNCPDVPQGATRTYGYAYNSRLSSTKLGDIPNPAATTAVYDSTKLGKNANDPLASIPSPGRHSGGNNYAFADGHIQWLTSDPSK